MAVDLEKVKRNLEWARGGLAHPPSFHMSLVFGDIERLVAEVEGPRARVAQFEDDAMDRWFEADRRG